jgi:hypothetical protein
VKFATFVLAAGLGLALFASPALAGSYDFSGTFTYDDDVVGLDFTVGSTIDVTIFSSSWISEDLDPSGSPYGFDPILAIWDMDNGGSLVHEQDDGGSSGSKDSNGTTYYYGKWDSYYTVALAAGNYRATITQYDNFAKGTHLSDGFDFQGDHDFTAIYGSQPYFNGVWDSNDPRTGDWEFHILNVDRASQVVPLPAAGFVGLGLLGVLGLIRTIRRRRS